MQQTQETNMVEVFNKFCGKFKSFPHKGRSLWITSEGTSPHVSHDPWGPSHVRKCWCSFTMLELPLQQNQWSVNDCPTLQSLENLSPSEPRMHQPTHHAGWMMMVCGLETHLQMCSFPIQQQTSLEWFKPLGKHSFGDDSKLYTESMLSSQRIRVSNFQLRWLKILLLRRHSQQQQPMAF